ncbi:MAG: glycosyltransferase family 2 protein [Candidatus Faecousia sp.]|nr:glycosyltransferase family 2 protein [Clostridiales bacterium]MDD7651001.1 glycosyltransferase family 2 protein [Bacillota bacterium]MDY4219854.1 glycosyltransferase family 2 protein [Candidatus Faecousia sp.]
MVLSIIIPVFNTFQYLEGCVLSILANDCTDCEILLIDDGSTDGRSPQLCDRLASEAGGLIRVIHQENQGQGGARNTGLEAARGEYLFFVDSDDTITSEALSVIRRAIKETHADVIAFDFYSDDGEGHHTPMNASAFHESTPFSPTERPEFLLSLPSPWSRVWKRSLFLDGNIRYPARVWYEDLRATVKLLAIARSIVALPDHLYLYLQRPGSTMHSSSLERNREIIVAFDDIVDWFTKNGLLNSYRDLLCRLAIDHLLLAASVRVAKIDPRSLLLLEFSSYMNEHFPDYRKNPYLSSLSKPKRLALFLVDHHQYRLLQFLFRNR